MNQAPAKNVETWPTYSHTPPWEFVQSNSFRLAWVTSAISMMRSWQNTGMFRIVWVILITPFNQEKPRIPPPRFFERLLLVWGLAMPRLQFTMIFLYHTDWKLTSWKERQNPYYYLKTAIMTIWIKEKILHQLFALPIPFSLSPPFQKSFKHNHISWPCRSKAPPAPKKCL